MTPRSSSEKLNNKLFLCNTDLDEKIDNKKVWKVTNLRQFISVECGETVLDAEIATDKNGALKTVNKATEDELKAQIDLWRVGFNIPKPGTTRSRVKEQLSILANDLKKAFLEVNRLNLEGATMQNIDSAMKYRSELNKAMEPLVNRFLGLTKKTETGTKVLAVNTLLGYRLELFNLLEGLIFHHSDPLEKQIMSSNLELVRAYFHSFTAALNTAKKEKTAVNYQQVSSYSYGVKLDRPIQWATGVLENSQDESWVNLSIALALVTGRRQVEIHSFAKGVTGQPIFTRCETEGHLNFWNQAKLDGKKGAAKKFFEENPSYEIPVLVDPELVLTAYGDFVARFGPDKSFDSDPLRVYSGDYKEVYKNVNSKVNNILSRTKNGKTPIIKQWAADFIECFDVDGNPVDINSIEFGDKHGFTYHSLRKLYTIKVLSMLPENINREAKASEILGHERGGKDVYAVTAQRYTKGGFRVIEG